jgi:hypothetical protein
MESLKEVFSKIPGRAIVVGSSAIRLHGIAAVIPNDFDFWLEPGVKPRRPYKRFRPREDHIKIYRLPGKIDLFSGQLLGAVPFEEVYARAIPVTATIRLVTLPDLVKLKKLSGRRKDFRHVRTIKKYVN